MRCQLFCSSYNLLLPLYTCRNNLNLSFVYYKSCTNSTNQLVEISLVYRFGESSFNFLIFSISSRYKYLWFNATEENFPIFCHLHSINIRVIIFQWSFFINYRMIMLVFFSKYFSCLQKDSGLENHE